MLCMSLEPEVKNQGFAYADLLPVNRLDPTLQRKEKLRVS